MTFYIFSRKLPLIKIYNNIANTGKSNTSQPKAKYQTFKPKAKLKNVNGTLRNEIRAKNTTPPPKRRFKGEVKGTSIDLPGFNK